MSLQIILLPEQLEAALDAVEFACNNGLQDDYKGLLALDSLLRMKEMLTEAKLLGNQQAEVVL